MSYLHHLLLFQTVTPLHVGCGRDVGVVDLPVFRDRTTGHPLVPGSGIRGAMRARFKDQEPENGQHAWTEEIAGVPLPRLTDKLFGPETGAGGEEPTRHAGSLAIHDAKLLLYPVRSDRRVYLWITCPAAADRLARELDVLVDPPPPVPRLELRGPVGDEELLGPTSLGTDANLEEIHLRSAAGEHTEADRRALTGWATRLGELLHRPELPEATALVSDATFHHFVNHATLVLQHNRLDAAKTVAQGQLFSVEAVPPEAVFFGFAGATAARWPSARADGHTEATDERDGSEPSGTAERLAAERVLALFRRGLFGANGAREATVHLGGHESTGLGVTRIVWAGPAAAGEGAGRKEATGGS
jgi:CRISPR-associated protein Cmr4